ncbi:MAG: Na/Pi cotransporter family protein [Oscillospiraceae bacterium]|nr:Na/Pi cotransporter family protein [Oscillospiraceae bacterium]
MTIYDGLALIGGLCLFLFGMNIMGEALEKCAGSRLKTILGKITGNKLTGFLLGLGVTAVIQSSSATTVMVVGFVNSGLMTLKQAINVIMGANVGTTVTAWLLSLSGISGDSFLVTMLKPTSFTPILALIGIVCYMFSKNPKKKDVGMILLGFATLMTGMETMSGAVSGLRDVPEFRNILLMFSNPILGVFAGALLTAVIQSSSASVGILQALSATGQITYLTAVPIIMGQNIGTCVTAMLSSVGTNKNARRTAVVHLLFNIIGTVVWLTVFCAVKSLVVLPILDESANQMGIAVIHSAFNILCTALLLPMSGILEKLAYLVVREDNTTDDVEELDERLMAAPAVAIAQCRRIVDQMASLAGRALKDSMEMLENYSGKTAETIRAAEDKTDRYEDTLGDYLVKLSSHSLSDSDRLETAELLHLIGDYERIADHAVNILGSAEEMREKGISFSPAAQKELKIMCSAVSEILDLSLKAYETNDVKLAKQVEPLEEVVDTLKEQLRMRHILRLQNGTCTIELGFVWADLLNSLERVADHCSNIAGRVIENANHTIELHAYMENVKLGDQKFAQMYSDYAKKYALVEESA